MKMDQNDFHTMVSKYQDSIARILYRMVRSQEDTRDLMQDAFLQLWKHRQQLENQRAACTYLYRITVNLAIDWLRRRKFQMLDSATELEQYSSAIPKDSHELFEAIMTCAQYLKPKQKAVFILKDVEGFEFEEIAVLMDTRLVNLRSNLYLARKKIKETLRKQYNITMEYWYDL